MTTTLAAPSPVPVPTPDAIPPEQRLDLDSVHWQQYVATSDALAEKRGVRLVYLDGGLTFLGTSRRHEWFAECLGYLVAFVASGCGIPCAPAGQATLRREDRGAGVEGDKTFYLGPNAVRMRGARDIDLTAEPPPDLAIEVEVSNPADKVMAIYGRLGVPEVWRFDVGSGSLKVWLRDENGSYAEATRSAILPMLEPADILGQLRLVEEIEFSPWFSQLNDWVRDVLVPRLGNGA